MALSACLDSRLSAANTSLTFGQETDFTSSNARSVQVEIDEANRKVHHVQGVKNLRSRLPQRKRRCTLYRLL